MSDKKWELVNFCEFDKYAVKSYCAIHKTDPSLNLGDITKADEKALPDFSMICGGSPCFEAGTRVQTKEGYKHIEDIEVGDTVRTHLNRFMPVTAVGGRKAQPIFRLKVQGFAPIYCTEDHPFYIKKTAEDEPEKVHLTDIEPGCLAGSFAGKRTQRDENGIIWYPVEEVLDTGRTADVYNIEVSVDHTYTANDIITFNCQDFSVAGVQKGSVWECEKCGYTYNPLTVHYSERNCCPECRSTELNKSRSSLLVEFLRIIHEKKPNFGIYENVKNIMGRRFKDTFNMFLSELDEYGYNTYYKVLNAKNYGIPQNRERVYLIFIKKELDNGRFEFPEGFDNGIRLADVLEPEVDERFYVSDRMCEKLKLDLAGKISHDNTTQNVGYSGTGGHKGRIFSDTGISRCLETTDHKQPVQVLTAEELNKILASDTNSVRQVGQLVKDSTWDNPQTGRVYSAEGACPTLNTCGGGNRQPKVVCVNDRGFREREPQVSDNISPVLRAEAHGNLPKVVLPDSTVRENVSIRIRKLTPKECFRLMGFDDSDYQAAKDAGVSMSQLYKQCGNSIVVDVLYYIYAQLYKAMPYLFDDLRLGSFFSGIGAFEKALDRLYSDTNNDRLNTADTGGAPEPELLFALHDRDRFGKFPQGYRVYNSSKTAVCLSSSSGGLGGISGLYAQDAVTDDPGAAADLSFLNAGQADASVQNEVSKTADRNDSSDTSTINKTADTGKPDDTGDPAEHTEISDTPDTGEQNVSAETSETAKAGETAGQPVKDMYILKTQRNEYGKQIRKQYEHGEIREQRKNMQEYVLRDDHCSNTLTTVQKDNYVAEVSVQQSLFGDVPQYKKVKNISPLRYPGGKAKLYSTIEPLFTGSGHQGGIFIEPFAGGAGIALKLLQNGKAGTIVLNDIDISVYSFWKAVLSEPDRFIKCIQTVPLTLVEYDRQHEIWKTGSDYSFELGFAAFYLNRTNHSGILSAGMIGGREQNKTYNIDARFNRTDLTDRVQAIKQYRNRISLYSMDITEFIEQVLPQYDNPFVYFDPPYYEQGRILYPCYFTHDDHARLEKALRSLSCDWVLSYDNAPEIRELYRDYRITDYKLRYSAGNNNKATEILISRKF